MSPAARNPLERARERLDRLELYARPVRIERVRLVALPLLFKLPRFRRYNAYAFFRTIVLRRPPETVSDDLLTHELCHIWQVQNRPLDVMVKFFTTRYRDNPYEREAGRAVRETR